MLNEQKSMLDEVTSSSDGVLDNSYLFLKIKKNRLLPYRTISSCLYWIVSAIYTIFP